MGFESTCRGRGSAAKFVPVPPHALSNCTAQASWFAQPAAPFYTDATPRLHATIFAMDRKSVATILIHHPESQSKWPSISTVEHPIHSKTTEALSIYRHIFDETVNL